MGLEPFRGLYAAVSTPIGNYGRPDVARLVAHCQWVLQQGAHGVCPFGTTGEGTSFSVAERKEALVYIINKIPSGRVMPVVGACSIDDAATLVGFATSLDCKGTLLLPPFYFKQPSEDGIIRYYADVIDRVGDDRLRLFVYNIPQVTRINITHRIVERLCADYGPIIVGVKDSCGNLEVTEAFCKSFPNLAIFTGTDAHIVAAMRVGGAGTVTGMGNVNPAALRQVVDQFDHPEAVKLCRLAGQLHLTMEKYGSVPAMKAVIAHYLDDPEWAKMAPPLVGLSASQTTSLIADLKTGGHVWPT